MKYNILFLQADTTDDKNGMALALRECLTPFLQSYDEMYAQDEVEIFCRYVSSVSQDFITELSKVINKESIDVIVGYEAGALCAHIMAVKHSIPCLVINPNYNQESGKIDKILKNSHICKQFVWGLFDENLAGDKIISTQERLFLENYSLSFHYSSNNDVYENIKKTYVPLIAQLIMEFAYYKKKQQEGETEEDKKWRLGVEYTHEFSQFYIDKMKQLCNADRFYRCDIDGDINHIIYKYRPDGKDTPYYINEDKSIMYDFVIEYHRGKPSEGIYYGCKAEILSGDMECHADELRELWPNIFMKDYNSCNALQRELTEILNNTFQWKRYFKCYKPTDNIWEKRYWLFWVTLCDDEDMNIVGVVATKIMAETFLRHFSGNYHIKEKKSKGRGRPSKRVEERFNTRHETFYTNDAYNRLLEKMGEGIANARNKQTFFFHDEKSVEGILSSLEKDGILTVNPKYERGWVLHCAHSEFKDKIKKILTAKKKEKYGEANKEQMKYFYPEQFDNLIMNEYENPVNKQRG